MVVYSLKNTFFLKYTFKYMSECGLNSGQNNGVFKFPPSPSEMKVYIFIILIVYTKSFTVFYKYYELGKKKMTFFPREMDNNNHVVQY